MVGFLICGLGIGIVLLFCYKRIVVPTHPNAPNLNLPIYAVAVDNSQVQEPPHPANCNSEISQSNIELIQGQRDSEMRVRQPDP